MIALLRIGAIIAEHPQRMAAEIAIVLTVALGALGLVWVAALAMSGTAVYCRARIERAVPDAFVYFARIQTHAVETINRELHARLHPTWVNPILSVGEEGISIWKAARIPRRVAFIPNDRIACISMTPNSEFAVALSGTDESFTLTLKHPTVVGMLAARGGALQAAKQRIYDSLKIGPCEGG